MQYLKITYLLVLSLSVFSCSAWADDTSTHLTWKDGGLDISSSFVGKSDGQLALIITYKNTGKDNVIIRKVDDSGAADLKVVFESDLQGSEQPTNWKLLKDQKLDEMAPTVQPIVKIGYDIIRPGDTYEQTFRLEKTYPRIVEVHKKSPVYVLWSKSVEVFGPPDKKNEGTTRGARLVKTRIGGFYIYEGGKTLDSEK